MKTCKYCNTELKLGENWTESRKKNYIYGCNSCIYQNYNKTRTENKTKYRKIQNDWRKSLKDGLNHVYIIDNYAGCTNNPYASKYRHKANGRDIATFRVVYSDNSREACLELEEFLHDLGYEGRHAFNRYV